MFYRFALDTPLYRFLRISLLAALVATGAAAQDSSEFVPTRGQDGKDVIWLPTEDTTVTKMLELAGLTDNDYLIDLGSGDGRTVIAAAKRGAKALGIEFNPKMVVYARQQAAKAGATDKAEFIEGDVFVADFSKATVLTMFLLPDINVRLQPKILAMAPGTRVVTNTFTMGEWKPDTSSEADKPCTNYCTAHLWYVPGKIAGKWAIDDTVFDLNQSFQMLAGAVVNGKDRVSLNRGKLKGNDFEFQAGSTVYEGRIEGDTLVGTKKVGGGTPTPFKATKVN